MSLVYVQQLCRSCATNPQVKLSAVAALAVGPGRVVWLHVGSEAFVW